MSTWDVSAALGSTIEVAGADRSGSGEAAAVGHLTVPPVERNLAVPPVVAALLALTDGAALFCPVGVTPGEIGADYEAILFDAAEIREETFRLRERMVDELPDIADELAAGAWGGLDTDALQRRVDGLWAIGQTMTGDSLVVEAWESVQISVYAHHFLLGNLLVPEEVVRCDGLQGLFALLEESVTRPGAYPRPRPDELCGFGR